ncbi:MAG: nuclear transport factor 2 family protein [Bacteroidota bacterium]
MKKSIRISMLVALASFTVLINPLKAQDVKKELDGFTKKYQDAYNKKDDKAIKMMYTADATRTDANGTVTTGNENIRVLTVTSWATSKPVLTITPEKADKQTDGTVIASGKYHVGGTKEGGEKLDINGTYTNTLVKEGGKWKISKMMLGN